MVHLLERSGKCARTVSLPVSEQMLRGARPMTLSLVDAKNVIVKDFSVIQPQFWYVTLIGPRFDLKGPPYGERRKRLVQELLCQRDEQ